MSSKFMKAVLAGTAAATLGLASTGAQAATASANATATILTPLTLSSTASLRFGNVVPAATAATVSVTAGGGFTCGAGLVCTGTNGAAGFQLTAGTVGQPVFVTIPVPTATLTSGANSMAVSALAASTGSFVIAGSDTFTVGGNLAVGANQAAGVYTGTFNVDVNY